MSEATAPQAAPRPYNLVAELTYRCPLRCPYCSNPVDHARRRDALGADDWARVFREAAALGVLQAGLTGGEPSARSDLREIVASAAGAGLFPHLVTSGMPLTPEGLSALAEAGLRSVQLSIQDATAEGSDHIAGTVSFERKLAIARATRELGLPLTLNVVLHRHNIGNVPALVALARELDAERLELANTQYHGWALANRDALLPTPEQIDAAAAAAREASRQTGGEARRPEILFVLPDWFRDRPKPCMGGWARKNLIVSPEGAVLPCQSAHSIPGLEFWNVTEHTLAECWRDAPGMNAFRGESWMREPCRSCPERGRDFGGCRCQAFALTGDAAATDPACGLSPDRERLLAARDAALARTGADEAALVWRGPRGLQVGTEAPDQ